MGRKARPSLPVDLYRCAEALFWEFRSLGEEWPKTSPRSDAAGPTQAKLNAPPVWTILWTPGPKSAAELAWVADFLFPPEQEALWPDEDVTPPKFELRADFPNVEYCLTHYAEQLAAAMKHTLFPRSARPGFLFKKLWFVCRAIAAAHVGCQLSTCLRTVNASRPDQRALARPRRPRTVRPVESSSPAPAA
jgi:hypothetical protein